MKIRLCIKRVKWMKNVSYLLLMLMTLIISFQFLTVPTQACSCAENGPPDESLRWSAAVFSGEVVKIVDTNRFKWIRSSADLVEFHFKVDQVWKGPVNSEVVVYSAQSSASCGYEFSLNDVYLVYAGENDGKLTASLCSRTTHMANAQEDLMVLGVGMDPVDNNQNSQPSLATSNRYIYWTLFSLLGLIILLVLLIIYRKKIRTK